MIAFMKYRTEWNLGLLYKSEKDPQIEKDMQMIEIASQAFEKKYKGKPFTETPQKLHAALKEYEALQRTTMPKPWWYFRLMMDIDSENTKAAAMRVKLEQRIRQAANKTIFFMLAIGRIAETEKKKYLKNPLLSRYTYLLQTAFELSKHSLTEEEEQLESLFTQTSFTMWVDAHQKLTNQQTVMHKGKSIPIAEATVKILELPKIERRQLQQKINQVFKNIAPSAEAELNALFAFRKIVDDRRGYKHPYSASVLEKENSEQEILDLVSVVTKYFSVSKRFFKLHAKLLGEKKIQWADYRAKIGTIKQKYDFETAVEVVRQTLKKIDPEYSDILKKFIERGQIDVYPRIGKTGGGYCWGMGHLPIYILLNHVGTIDSVETLAHEMGHAIHGELDDNLPYHYQDHSIAVAEVASTFFEQAVSEDLMESLSDEERLIFLHSKVNTEIYAVFGQIIGFNYELELHETARVEGWLTKEKMAELMQKHLKSYLGDAVDVTVDDGYRYTYWMHLRMIFYLYSYAYGQLISRALYERWKADHAFAAKVRQFLSAGRSMSPRDIFKSIGITVDKKFFELGLKGIEKDVIALEKLAKKLKKI
jgi:oligoendopeptidase F